MSRKISLLRHQSILRNILVLVMVPRIWHYFFNVAKLICMQAFA